MESAGILWHHLQPQGGGLRGHREMRLKSRGGNGGVGVDEARDSREDGARRICRDACLHGIPAGALALDQDEDGIERINREARMRMRLKYIVERGWSKRG